MPTSRAADDAPVPERSGVRKDRTAHPACRRFRRRARQAARSSSARRRNARAASSLAPVRHSPLLSSVPQDRSNSLGGRLHLTGISTIETKRGAHLQTPKPYRAMLRQAQALPPFRHPLRPKNDPPHRLPRPRRHHDPPVLNVEQFNRAAIPSGATLRPARARWRWRGSSIVRRVAWECGPARRTHRRRLRERPRFPCRTATRRPHGR